MIPRNHAAEVRLRQIGDGNSVTKLSIAIGGAGIGGLTAAILLARDGHDIVLYDQFAAPEPIGSGLMLQETGLAVLRALGFIDQIEAYSTPIGRLFGKSQPSGNTVLDVRFSALRDTLRALGIQRYALFMALFDAAKAAGVRFEASSRITETDADSGRFIFENGKQSLSHDLLVDALGARSPLSTTPKAELPFGALWATVSWPNDKGFLDDALEQRYRAAARMTGMMPSGRATRDGPVTATYFWSIEGETYDAWKARGITAWRDDACELWPETECVVSKLDADQLVFARYRHRTHGEPVRGKLFHVGDSWHATSPQLGQGANMALLDAYALTAALRQTNNDLSDAAVAYVRMRRGHIRLYQAMSYLFTPVYQSHGKIVPALRDHLAAPVSRIPPAPQILAALVSGAFGSPLKKLGLVQYITGKLE